MRKLLTILTLSLISIASIFAKSAQVQLETSVEETPVSYELAYNNDVLADGIEEYSILVAPLTQDGKTEYFTITASSNMNNDLAVDVRVHAHSFQTTLNGNTAYDSKIEPKVNTITRLSSLKAGNNENVLVNKFNLSWEGNEDLPAGKYVSNVYIYYSIK
ncbi:hypothetical protein EOM09_02120 [bacterium]|nr:hypothetical protein [bacterium]